MNQKSPKGPKSILILTMKLLLTYFWKTQFLKIDSKRNGIFNKSQEIEKR